jgi:hypothetical protein
MTGCNTEERTTHWTTDEMWFDLEQKQAICLSSRHIQTGSAAHPALYSVDSGLFPVVAVAGS